MSSADTENNNNKKIILPSSMENLLFISNDTSIKIDDLEKKIENRRLSSSVVFMEDVPLGLNRNIGSLVYNETVAMGTIDIHLSGYVNGKYVFQVKLQPHHYQRSTSNIKWIQEWKIQIVGKNIEYVSDNITKNNIIHSLTKEYKENYLRKSDSIIQNVQVSNPIRSKRLKIWIDHEGIYVITQPMLVEAGWDISSIDPRFFYMVNLSKEIPIRIIGEEDGSFDVTDAIEFFGEPLWNISPSGERRLDVYSDKNVYWLELGEKYGIRLGQEEGFPSNKGEYTGRSYLYTEHIEKDYNFSNLPFAEVYDEEDYWFYSSEITGGVQRDFGFNLNLIDKFSTQLVTIRIKLRLNVLNVKPLISHTVAIFINDQIIASKEMYDNQTIILESDDFSPMFLREGSNRLTISNQSDNENKESVNLYMDWFEITFPKLYKANNNYIRFKPSQFNAGKFCLFEIDGFSDKNIDIYKKSTSCIFGSEIIGEEDSLGNIIYKVTFQDFIMNDEEEYIAVASKYKSLPDSISLINKSELKSDGAGADYIMIIPEDSLGKEVLSDLILLRENQGLRVSVVSLDSIYNTFNYGIPHSKAIRKFLTYAYYNWSPTPRFVLLVGDGYSNNRATTNRNNLLPVRHYQTHQFGGAASDYWYTVLNDDNHFSDIAIGRLPIRNRQELEIVIKKIIDYEQSPVKPWKNRYLLIGAHETFDSFRLQSESLINNVFSYDLRPERLYLSEDSDNPNFVGTEDLMKFFQEGVSLINFRGHGGGGIWADNNLLNLDDIDLIENKGKFPVITSMTCFTGDFASPGRTLGEALVCQEDAGAIVFWGASGTGWTSTDYYLLRELFKLFKTDPDLTFGEMINKAKNSFLLGYSSNQTLSNIYQYVLLGDPAIRLAFPTQKTKINLQNRSLRQGGSIQLQGTVYLDNSNIQIELTGQDLSVIQEYQHQPSLKNWNYTFQLPSSFKDTTGGIRSFVWNNQFGYQAHKYVPFSFKNTFFDSIQTIPEEPTYHDEIQFFVIAEDPDGIQNIWCKLTSPVQDSLEMVSIGNSYRYKTQQKVGPFSPGKKVTFFFIVNNRQGASTTSNPVSFYLPKLPDLKVDSLYLNGTDQVLLTAKIKNIGGSDVQSSVIRFSCPDINFYTENTISINSKDELKATVPFSARPGNMLVSVHINPDTTIEETDYSNNRKQSNLEINHFNVTPEKGTYLGTGSDYMVGLPNRMLCYIPPGAVSKNSVLQVEAINQFSEMQDSIKYSHPLEIFRFALKDHSKDYPLLKDATLYIFFNDSAIDCSSQPYRWDDSIRRWTYYPSTCSDSFLVVHTKTPGYYGLLNSTDNDPPNLEIQIENQPFSESSYVSMKPHISLIIQDQSGIDIRPGKIIIRLDDLLQETENLIIPDSTKDPTEIVVSLRPELNSGDHTIAAQVYDIHGNMSRINKIRFKVSSEFEIQYLGNHPNPFKRETIFVYILTNEAERVLLKIYTVSGKLIKTFDQHTLASADYHEIFWDGKDEWGEEVANGVYFFSLKVNNYQDKHEITGKIAKLR
jgi:hypothetical protein